MDDTEIKLKELITARYGSMKKFCEIIGMPWTTLDSILKRGVANSNITNVLKITRELNIDAERLADGIIVSSTEEGPMYHTPPLSGQASLFELPTGTESTNILESELLGKLRVLQDVEHDEYLELCYIFSRIPSLSKEFRKKFRTKARSIISQYDEQQMKENIRIETANSPSDAQAFFDIINATASLDFSNQQLNAAHERTDIDVTEDMKKHDDDIMNDKNFDD